MTVPHQAPPRPLHGTPAEEYIDSVLSCIPAEHERARVERELRARLDPRMTIEQAIATYGEPRAIAEFYLASTELESAPFLRRIAAALIDIPSVITVGILFFVLTWRFIGVGFGTKSFIAALLTGNPIAIGLLILTGVIMTPMYYIIAETWTSRTIGKALMGLRTVRESGARITVGQAVVRQIPLFFSFYLFDAAFALFTKKRQRLFELISKTRVVRA